MKSFVKGKSNSINCNDRSVKRFSDELISEEEMNKLSGYLNYKVLRETWNKLYVNKFNKDVYKGFKCPLQMTQLLYKPLTTEEYNRRLMQRMQEIYESKIPKKVVPPIAESHEEKQESIEIFEQADGIEESELYDTADYEEGDYQEENIVTEDVENTESQVEVENV